MGRIKITQTRSAIKRPFDQKRTLVALGIKKLQQTVEMEATPQVLGMVNKISHLVVVENVK
jgi:large subunit ribosomal protein L30